MAFDGKRILITGAAKGLGLEVAKRFGAEKGTVILLDSDEPSLKAAVAGIPNSEGIQANLLDWEETRKKVEGLGYVHHLVNNAALLSLGSFMEASKDMIDSTFGVNVRSVVNVSQCVAKVMLAQESGGTIVNICSVGSKRALPQSSIYCASKSALAMLTTCMAVELSPKVRVNAICPGLMDTALLKQCRAEFPSGWTRHLGRTPMNRLVELSEAANAVLFLSSPQSSMIVGALLDVDGGYLLT